MFWCAHVAIQPAPRAGQPGRPSRGLRRARRTLRHRGAALLWTLNAGLGEKFTPDVREAWTAADGLLADVMQFGALEAERIKRQQERAAACA